MAWSFPDDVLQRAAEVRLLILDVDGVLTDGRLYYGPEGEVLKVFNAQDGHAIKSLRAAGIPSAIISGRSSPMVRFRAQELGIEHLWLGVDNKVPALDELALNTGIALSEMAHMGDDQPDLPLFARVGMSFAPANAHPEVRDAAHYNTRAGGGEGAVCEVCALLQAARQL